MKGIKCCGECANYSYKKHKCLLGCNKETDPRSNFYDDCPLPDAVKVKHGKWITWEMADNCIPAANRHECSVCHDAAQVLANGAELLSFYCPNCGAMMQEDKIVVTPQGKVGKAMNKYIDINALGIGKANPAVFENPEYANGWNSAIKILENAPAADVAPVRHGRWLLEREPDGKPFCFHCSVCDSDFHYIGITVAYDYCPNCGAKMDGGENDGN